MTKPFDARTVARIRSFAAASGSTAAHRDQIGRCGSTTTPAGAREARCVADAVRFDLLATLISTPGVYSRIEPERLQGTVIDGAEKTINVHIHNCGTITPGQPDVHRDGVRHRLPLLPALSI